MQRATREKCKAADAEIRFRGRNGKPSPLLHPISRGNLYLY
jgi:hypothetical protein